MHTIVINLIMDEPMKVGHNDGDEKGKQKSLLQLFTDVVNIDDVRYTIISHLTLKNGTELKEESH